MSQPRDPGELQARLRGLPSVQRVIDALVQDVPHAAAARAARRAVDLARAAVRAGGKIPTLDEVVTGARAVLDDSDRALLQPVINATGVLIHTNLGRVPLGEEQMAEVARIAGGYSNLELDLAAGRRGSRYAHAERALVELTGAESALVVNNNAAALLLVLAALCSEREVIISRGELVEIGGEFRIPDVMALSGARLIEVGTTNRTHLADYERAIGSDTAAILKVHPSNYTITGFTAAVSGRDLGRLAKGRGVLFLHDIGSGSIAGPRSIPQLTSEPPVDASLDEGADLVTFSGDKLFGGPQAGVIAGREELIRRISRHPLLRAVRVDKMTLAALEATSRALLEGDPSRLPLWALALEPMEELERRARAIAAHVDEALGAHGVKTEVVASRSVTGGGSLPGEDFSSWAVALTHGDTSTAEVERALRHGAPPVVARIEDDRVLVDLRAVAKTLDPVLCDAIVGALS
ncbi:L-seryl-tRNA(Sec) selenium transferase [soil metagenome]